MTTTYPHESALGTERITVYADTLLSLTKGRQYSNLPYFSNTRILAFIHQLTDKQLDYTNRARDEPLRVTSHQQQDRTTKR